MTRNIKQYACAGLLISAICLLTMCQPVWGAEPTAQSASVDKRHTEDRPSEIKIVTGDLKFKDKSLFTDVVATAYISLPDLEETGAYDAQSEDDDQTFLDGGDSVNILSIDVLPPQKYGQKTPQVMLRFLPLKKGLIVFPELKLPFEHCLINTKAIQLTVSEPQETSLMSLEMLPQKTKVYVNQPLRIDVTWQNQLVTNRVRTLNCLPSFFNQPDLHIVIPRTTAPKTQHMGMPFGGRRLIVPRKAHPSKPLEFGAVSFPLYIQFQKPGTYSFDAVKLECAYLKGQGSAFSPYAAYYNNGLFEPLSALEAYERLYTHAKPFEIEVLPLPEEGRKESFSNLFMPCSFTVAMSRSRFVVGQVMELDIRVRGDAPHGMLALPKLSSQKSLRGLFRASDEYGQTWYSDGTGFRVRMRALSSEVNALPSLQFQVFDTQSGQYKLLQTNPLELDIRPTEDGRTFFNARSLSLATGLTLQKDGIWHNMKVRSMSGVIHGIIGMLADYFWYFIWLGPVVFLLLLSRVRLERKKANDPIFRKQMAAYRLCMAKHPLDVKWKALKTILAVTFNQAPEAWTEGDSSKRLIEMGATEAEIEQLVQYHHRFDQKSFAAKKMCTESVDNDLDRKAIEALAGHMLAICKRVTIYIVLAMTLSSQLLGEMEKASMTSMTSMTPWQRASTLFDQALASPMGYPETESLFKQAALQYEAAAESHRGKAWFNAGNSWFKGGRLGRAIACYRQAQIYLPFDRDVQVNLKAARALTLDVLDEDTGYAWIKYWDCRYWSLRWLYAGLALLQLFFWGTLLCHVRYRSALSRLPLILCSVIAMMVVSAIVVASYHKESRGVLIFEEVFGRKGPAFNYQQAFEQALHDGLEFEIIEVRESWLLILLADQNRCWIPRGSALVIQNDRS